MSIQFLITTKLIRKLSWLFIAFICLNGLLNCHKESRSEKDILTIKRKQITNALFYSGVIKPIRTEVVTAVADGIVTERAFQYGQQINQGQLLFQISSNKFLADYKTALMAYIKAKNEFDTTKGQSAEAKFLYQHQLISKDEFNLKKSSYYTAQLSLLQTKDALENLTRQLSLQTLNPYHLSITDIDQINKVMHLKKNAQPNIHISSPTNGIVLSSRKSGGENKKIHKGDAVKQGDVLAIVGDMSGISISIKVNELTVNQLHVGQPVKITGIAFPDIVLNGVLQQVDQQGEINHSGLPLFSAVVIVGHLGPSAKKVIRIGMSAKVEIDIDEAKQITVPINALNEQAGKAFVTLYNERSGKTLKRKITTGKTTFDSVIVLSGLSEGDKIVIPHSTT